MNAQKVSATSAFGAGLPTEWPLAAHLGRGIIEPTHGFFLLRAQVAQGITKSGTARRRPLVAELQVRLPVGADVATLRSVLFPYLPVQAQVLKAISSEGYETETSRSGALDDEAVLTASQVLLLAQFSGEHYLYARFTVEECRAAHRMTRDYFARPESQSKLDELEQQAQKDEHRYRALLGNLLGQEIYPLVLQQLGISADRQPLQTASHCFNATCLDAECCQLWLESELLMRNGAKAAEAHDWLEAHAARLSCLPMCAPSSESVLLSARCALPNVLLEAFEAAQAGRVAEVNWRADSWNCASVASLIGPLLASWPDACRVDTVFLHEAQLASSEVLARCKIAFPLPAGEVLRVRSLEDLRADLATKFPEHSTIRVIRIVNGASTGSKTILHAFLVAFDGASGKAKMVNCWRGVYTFAQWEGDDDLSPPISDGFTGFAREGFSPELEAARKRFGHGQWLHTSTWRSFFDIFATLLRTMRSNHREAYARHCEHLFGVPRDAVITWPDILDAGVHVTELTFRAFARGQQQGHCHTVE